MTGHLNLGHAIIVEVRLVMEDWTRETSPNPLIPVEASGHLKSMLRRSLMVFLFVHHNELWYYHNIIVVLTLKFMTVTNNLLSKCNSRYVL